MADAVEVSYTGARPGDALLSFQGRTIRTVYVPASLFGFALTVAKGLELQDAGARGFLSGMGTPAAASSGAIALDWRVVSAANPSAKLSDAIAVLADNAALRGARLVQVSAAPSSRGVDGAAADRQAAAANASGRVPTIAGTVGGAIDKATDAAGSFVSSALWWLVLFVLLALAGLYLLRDSLPAVARAVTR